MASSSLVADPWAARSLNRPRRSPSTHRRVTYVPLISPITLPMNACTFASSSIGCAVVVIVYPPRNLVLPTVMRCEAMNLKPCMRRSARGPVLRCTWWAPHVGAVLLPVCAAAGPHTRHNPHDHPHNDPHESAARHATWGDASCYHGN